jgi:hypothetical protein
MKVCPQASVMQSVADIMTCDPVRDVACDPVCNSVCDPDSDSNIMLCGSACNKFPVGQIAGWGKGLFACTAAAGP